MNLTKFREHNTCITDKDNLIMKIWSCNITLLTSVNDIVHLYKLCRLFEWRLHQRSHETFLEDLDKAVFTSFILFLGCHKLFCDSSDTNNIGFKVNLLVTSKCKMKDKYFKASKWPDRAMMHILNSFSEK